ncbi:MULTISPECIES: hypothetical protein [unclassified Diaminobutyricimonas]|uniref:COG4315 family predicted lipoprotein n=1 Tax=unclassified Diaminobutyricimonas TaxID=2643261 RepID=UPI0012F4F4FF|nr:MULTISPECIES: hypothetical protein [unclassified Diaminobutyricimonas]
MKLRIATGLTATAIAILLTGCTGTTDDTTQPPADEGTSEASPESSEAVLMTAESDEYGEIVVDAEGMTVYMFDQDTQDSGTSTCEGMCLTNWPPVTAEGDDPEVEGVTGEVGTITATDGSTQLTLNGWPLYYYAGDTAAGDTNGQGVNEVWWVLDPAGERLAE